MSGEPTEREWTDEFGTFYEVKGVGADGRLYSLKLMRGPHSWPSRRKTAYAEVKTAMAAAQDVKPERKPGELVINNGPFWMGQRVRKKTGAQWQGHICGVYHATHTPIGYAVESEREIGSVQIYPAAALEVVP